MKPGKCVDRIERMKGVEREYQVATMAKEVLIEGLGQDTTMLTKKGLHQADLNSLQANLEATYLVRLFAEFETGLKDYWKNGLTKNSRTGVRDIIESLSSRFKILDAAKTNAHAVRKYRNRLVHEEDADGEPVDLKNARGYLCRFFGFLPSDW